MDISEDDELANLWRDPEMKKILIANIKEKPEYQNATTEKLKLITDKAIIEQFWKLWIDIDETKEPYRKLSNHPSLTLKDFDQINQVVMKYREKQFYWSLGFTGVTLGIYSAFFQKNRLFYNFFRKKSRFQRWPVVKKGLCCFGVFWSWLLILNYFLEKQIPFDLKEKKLFEKYNIDFNRGD